MERVRSHDPFFAARGRGRSTDRSGLPESALFMNEMAVLPPATERGAGWAGELLLLAGWDSPAALSVAFQPRRRSCGRASRRSPYG